MGLCHITAYPFLEGTFAVFRFFWEEHFVYQGEAMVKRDYADFDDDLIDVAIQQFFELYPGQGFTVINHKDIEIKPR